MNPVESILQKITARLDTLQKEDRSVYPDDYKQHLSVEEAVYRRIQSELVFQMLTPEDRQAKRIEYLASCIKPGGDFSVRPGSSYAALR